MEANEFLEEYKSLVEKLFDILEVELEELTKQEKELILAYSFGMISIIEQESQMSEEVKHLTLKQVIMETFEYNEEDAKNIFKKLIYDIKEKRNEPYNIMIYQGKFTYSKFRDKNYNEVYDNLTNMIDVIVSGEYKTY